MLASLTLHSKASAAVDAPLTNPATNMLADKAFIIFKVSSIDFDYLLSVASYDENATHHARFFEVFCRTIKTIPPRFARLCLQARSAG